MNHRVPDFDMADDDYFIPTSSSSIPRQHKAEDDVMELLWQNGQVVAHSQMQRSHHNHKSPPTNTPPPPENTSQLYIAEDEMATWLHYPLEDLYIDLLYPTSAPPQPPPLPPPPPQQTFQASRALDARPPQLPPPSRPPAPPPRNFPHFSRFSEKAPTPSTGVTVVESNKPEATPVTGGSSPAATSVGEMSAAMSRAPPIRGGGGSGYMSHLTVSSSTSGSGTGSGSGSGTSGAGTAVTTAVEEGGRKQEVVEDRKRKGRETDEPTAAATTTECHTEDVEHESAEEREHSRGSSAKRSRAAEVHNLSERRRRDRINEKMRALQELIPRCNKSDKASMLDEAIEYLKSLQMQVQIMSMGCGMVPFLYPGMQQQYMPHMGMGIGMGMDMGMSRPMMPFPTAVPLPTLPATPGGSMVFRTPAVTAATQLAPRFPVPAFPMHPASQPGVAGALSNQAESIRNPASIQTPALPQVANLPDPYQQYLALQQMQVQMQNQSVSQPSSSKPSSSRPSTSMSEEGFDDSQRAYPELRQLPTGGNNSSETQKHNRNINSISRVALSPS
ncbi:hypothetical protein Cgig2_009309 [Carnegiea gigantea]|uniref:BHLH domain-containing protein n=1 Tax=Carnegiea gigantea TaxID=171969 RepID=A0A9Q1JWU4_9CARY|nr:hypothetical protein Cgig2_009309 [Carnegiea gigantea]